MKPRVDIVFPVLPPVLDGIGDHTARLAASLSHHADVHVLTTPQDPTPIPGVTITPAFTLDQRHGVRGLLASITRHPPDWLLLQFNQFSYGRWGMNLYLPRVLQQIRQRCPATRIAWLAHEDFVPCATWKFAVMSTWQRWQFWQLGKTADLILFTIDYWAARYRSWFPKTPIGCLPVGSNIPDVQTPRALARRRLGLRDDTFVVGYFGSLHNSRLPHLVRHTLARLRTRTNNLLMLYVGADGDRLRRVLHDVMLYDAGPLPAKDVSAHLAAMDLYLAPFIDGVSTRRGSFMASLQHGIPTVATLGPHTGDLLRHANGTALLLADEKNPADFAAQGERLFEDPGFRASIGARGQQLYASHFDWPVLAQRLADMMRPETTSAWPPPRIQNPIVAEHP